MKLIKEYIFEDYPMTVNLSQSQRARYYYNDKKIPYRLVNKLNLDYDWELKVFTQQGKKVKKEILVDMVTRKPILKNEKTVNTPKTKRIRGQELHDLTLLPGHRSLIVDTLKTYFVNNMVEQGVVQEVIQKLYLELEFTTDERYVASSFTDNLQDANIGDLDNHELFYKKTLFDCLQHQQMRKSDIQGKPEMVINPCGFIPYDNVRYLNDYRVIFINTPNTRTLKFRIYDKTDN